MIRTLNLEGDGQADLSAHGGTYKAVYAYPAEHYDFWHAELPDMQLPWGMFGENLTTTGLLEDEVNIGDRIRVGEAELMATQPRFPCYKLSLKFGRNDMLRRFLESGRSGIYFSVVREGEVGAGDTIERIGRDPAAVTVRDIVRLYVEEPANVELLKRAANLQALPEMWRDYFRERLAKLGA